MLDLLIKFVILPPRYSLHYILRNDHSPDSESRRTVVPVTSYIVIITIIIAALCCLSVSQLCFVQPTSRNDLHWMNWRRPRGWSRWFNCLNTVKWFFGCVALNFQANRRISWQTNRRISSDGWLGLSFRTNDLVNYCVLYLSPVFPRNCFGCNMQYDLLLNEWP